MPSKNNRKLITTSYVWDIRNLAYLESVSKPGEFLRSPLFNARSINKAWKFRIYLKGKSSEDYISFYINKINPSSQTIYNCTLSIGRPDTTPIKSYKYIDIRFLDNVIGEEFFLLKKSNSWILRGPVRFQCDITEISSNHHDLTHVSFSKLFDFRIGFPDIANLSMDLEKLLKVPFHSDLTVNVNGFEIYVHKYILNVRCPELSYEFGFRSIMEMPPSVEIQVSDEIFELLMHYIYTGKLRDSYISLELFRYAEHLRLLSLMQCVHEQAYNYHVYSEADVENQVISWNLDELNILEEASTYVHILRTKLYVDQLAIQISVSDGCEKEKFIHISFKIFGLLEHSPIALVCKISLTSQAGLVVSEEAHVFFQVDEQWNVLKLPCQKDAKNMCLTAELSMSNALYMRNPKGNETKIKLHTDFQTITENLENLRSNMGFLFQMAQSTSNLILLSADNKFFRVHDGIMWARWPGVMKLIDVSSVSSDEEIDNVMSQLELKLPSEILDILLPYLYTGFISNFNRAKAEFLLKYSNCLEYPDHLVAKCKAMLSDNHQNQL